MQIWRYQNPQTPEPIDIKFGVGDYVGNVTREATIQNDSPIGFHPVNLEAEKFFFVIHYLKDQDYLCSLVCRRNRVTVID